MFSELGIWTMVHGIGLSGAAMMGMAAALFYMGTVRPAGASAVTPSDALTRLAVFNAVMLWLAVLVGTYVIFPAYRITPPAGIVDLAQYPRALILSDPSSSWLHRIAMETKEHVPWIAAMLVTAVAAIGLQYRSKLMRDVRLRTMSTTLLGIAFVLVSIVGLLGILINKYAPTE